jgi:hypothetical protein
MAFLESLFGNPSQQPKALQRFGLALQGPAGQEAELRKQALTLEQQKQQQLRDLLARVGNVPAEGMGPQQPLDTKSFLTQLAGITGDAGGLASFLVSQQKQDADQLRQKQIAQVLGMPGESPLASMATAGNASGPNPLSVRNNNPGNMRPVGSSEGFQQFSTPEEGLMAMRKDLEAKISGNSPAMTGKFGSGYTPTLANVISTWAPPEENDTLSYIQNVSQKTGISPDQPLTSDDIDKVQSAMIEQEGGQAASAYFGGKEEQSPAVSKLAKLAMIDPDNFADDYISAQAQEEQDRIKARQDADKTLKEDAKVLTEGEGALRKEFEGLPDVKQFRDVESSYQRVLKATANPTAAGDVALIFNYMKMLDPGSTVREGEFATAQNSAGIPTQIWNLYNKAMSGERLAPEQRQDFLNQAGGQYKAAEELFNVRADQYSDLASSYNYKPSRIVTRARGKVPASQKVSVDPKLLEFMTPEERALFE